MDAGAFRVFLLILASTVELWADGAAIPAVTTNKTTTVTNAVSITTNSPSVTTNTVLVPEVVGSTNAPPGRLRHEFRCRSEAGNPSQFGSFFCDPTQRSFRLTKPEPRSRAGDRCAQNCRRASIGGHLHLAWKSTGCSAVSPPRGGRPSMFSGGGRRVARREVTKIDLSQGLVEVLVRGQTFRWSWIKK